MTKRSGYSLVEILVVLGIMGLLAAAGIAAYNQLNNIYQVNAETKKLVTGLRNWQKEVDSGMGAKQCSSGQVFGGRRIHRLDSAHITAALICDGSPTNSVSTLTLANGVTVSEFGDFNILPVAGGMSKSQEITLTKAGTTATITITQAGGISAGTNN